MAFYHRKLHLAHLVPIQLCAYVIEFAPMMLSFSYLLGFKELVALKS